MPTGKNEKNAVGGLWRVAVLLSGWAFVFLTTPPVGAISANVAVVDAAVVVDLVIVAFSAWVLWVDTRAAARAGLLDGDPRVAFTIVFFTYLVSVPFYTGYRLYEVLK